MFTLCSMQVEFSECMLRLQNEMQVADTSRLGGSEKPYRGFESFSLRHAV